ncbi:MAG: hypothetical protein J6B22_01280 [Clostridia bacterium]|nr:hypothetical protein [Clostridia bacterium]
MENNENKMVFEDISSSSPNSVKKVVKQAGKIAKTTAVEVKKASDAYGNLNHEKIEKVIKIISFVVAIGVFLLFLVAAGIIFFLDHALIFLSALILLFGSGLALICLYLIYAQGYMIAQNKEILERLGK